MKTAIRWVVLCVVGAAAAAPYAASAASPASNGAGDGEANVPFASEGGGADAMGRGSVAPGEPRGDGARARVAGRAAGTRAHRTVSTDAAVQTEADRAFEQRVWTAP